MSDVEISLVVATYDRPLALARCLASLLKQRTSRRFEVIVVDNHPQSGITDVMVNQFPQVHFVGEMAPGLSRARNRGIAEAKGSVIVTTDDDVVASEGWLEKLTSPLFYQEPGDRQTSFAATTGNCLASKIETEAETLFEAYGGLRHGGYDVNFDAAWMARWRICCPQLWRIGTTANAAFRASLFRDGRIGLFETRLGAGTPAGAWEDLYCFYRILRAGYRIAYLADANVLHTHREDIADLTRQICGYRHGETAFLTLLLLRHRDWRAIGQMLFWIPWWRFTLLSGELLRRFRGVRRYSLRLFWAEAVAYLTGPWTLWQSHRIARQADQNGAKHL